MSTVRFNKVCPSCTGSKVCSRCGGDGRYSFNPRDLDVCFGCSGAGTCSSCGGTGIKFFIPRDPNDTYFYISTGEKNKLFTLKSVKADAVTKWVKGDFITSTERHEIVLSADPDKAIEKAKAYLEEIYPNEEKLPKLLTDAVLDAELSPITRRTKEEIELEKEREKMKIVIGAALRKGLAFREWSHKAHKRMDEGRNPFDGYNIDDMPLVDINYSAKLKNFKSDVHKRFSEICKSLARHIPENANKHLGVVGEKTKIRAMLLDHDNIDTAYGMNLKLKWIAENGERFITNGSVGSVFNKKIYDEYLDIDHLVDNGPKLPLDRFVEIEATIKAHNSFDPSEDSTWDFGRKIVFKEGDGKVIYKTTKLIRPKLIS